MSDSWQCVWGGRDKQDSCGADAPAAGAVVFYMTRCAGRLKHFPGGENAAVSTTTGAAAAPADASLAVASHWIGRATDGRTAGGHRQIARIRMWRIVLEGIYRAARRRFEAGRAAGRVGRSCFHHVRTIAEIRRFDNGHAAAPDRRGTRLSGYSGPRLAAPGRAEIPSGLSKLVGLGIIAGLLALAVHVAGD